MKSFKMFLKEIKKIEPRLIKTQGFIKKGFVPNLSNDSKKKA
jgi:hypothetical protein